MRKGVFIEWRLVVPYIVCQCKRPRNTYKWCKKCVGYSFRQFYRQKTKVFYETGLQSCKVHRVSFYKEPQLVKVIKVNGSSHSACAMEKSSDTHPTSCNFLDFNKMSKVKKVLDDAKEQNNPEIDLVDKGITSFEEMPGLRKC